MADIAPDQTEATPTGADDAKLFWLDMEMTGLDPDECVPIEVAAIVTNLEFIEFETFEAVISADQTKLDAMDEWNTSTHTGSGLLERVKSFGCPLSLVDGELAALVAKHFGDTRAVLCGNSIHQDRRFLDIYFPKTAALLHYRMVDVSSFKEIMRRKWDVKFDKQQNHRALDDIRESIAELVFYLQGFTPPTG